MSCKSFESLWILREEGRLNPEEASRLSSHVSSCTSCARLQQEMDQLEHGLVALSDLPADAPPYLKTRILARVEEMRPRRRWFFSRLFTSRRLLAVSMACLAFFAGLLVREVRRVNEWLRESPVQTVVLEYVAPDARDVALVGDFNAWGRNAEPLRAEKKDGRWVFRVELEPGRYQYAFLVDGKRWLPDPDAPGMIPDGFGGMNSVLYVQEPTGSSVRSL